MTVPTKKQIAEIMGHLGRSARAKFAAGKTKEQISEHYRALIRKRWDKTPKKPK